MSEQSQVFPTLIEKWHLGSSNLIKLNFATGSHIARLSIEGSITAHSHSNTWTLSTQQCSNTWTPDTQQCSNSTYPIKTHIEVTQYHIKWFEENVARINKRSQGGTPPLGIICIKLTKLMHWRTGSWVDTYVDFQLLMYFSFSFPCLFLLAGMSDWRAMRFTIGEHY